MLPPGPAHLIGIGGYGMRGLARLLAASGRRVTGSDGQDGAALRALRAEGIPCAAGHRAGNLPPDAAVVILSAAVPASNPEARLALERGLPCRKYAEALGAFCADRRVIACAGTHGKSTSTAVLAWLLRRAGIAAGHLVGADPAPGMPDLPACARAGDPMVVEACEYDRSFLNFSPWGAIITNVEKEHVDCFPTLGSLHEAFRSFAGRMVRGGVLAVPPDLVDRLGLPAAPGTRVVTFGMDGEWRPASAVSSRGIQEIAIVSPRGEIVCARLALPGRHNVTNVTGAVALACELFGIERCRAAASELDRFRGLRRRFEIIGAGDPVVIDDYAHHPTEIAATIQAARERFPATRRIVAVFQPHQRTRLEALSGEFVDALLRADRTVVTPVFAARESGADDAQASAAFAERLAAAGGASSFCADFGAARAEILDTVEPGDVVLCLGAGDITDFAAALAGALPSLERTHAEKT